MGGREKERVLLRRRAARVMEEGREGSCGEGESGGMVYSRE